MRAHLQIENDLHWALDVKMNEDASRTRRGNPAEIISGIKKMALNLLEDYEGFKAGITSRRNSAVLKICYIMEVLAYCTEPDFGLKKRI